MGECILGSSDSEGLEVMVDDQLTYELPIQCCGQPGQWDVRTKEH